MTRGTVLKSTSGDRYDVIQEDPVRVRHHPTGITSFVSPETLKSWKVIHAGVPRGFEGLVRAGDGLWVRDAK